MEGAAAQKHQDYFKYITPEQQMDPANLRDINKAKLKGKFKIDLKESLSPNLKVQAFANDYMSYYMHKNGHFLKRIHGGESMEEQKRSKRNEKVGKVLEKY